MPSLQNSMPNSKAAKFVNANPLGPMADPFAGLDGEEKEAQKELSDNIQKRMTNAMDEIKTRHANGTAEADDIDKAPTGSAYHAAAQMKRSKQMQERQREEETKRLIAMKAQADQMFRKDGNDGARPEDDDQNGDDKSDASSDDEYDDLLNDDTELEIIRQRRLAQMRAQQTTLAKHKALGHGEVRTISQDQFLPECTGDSEWVAVHFFHKEFERCKIMDHHLKIVASQHLECKFLRMDAEMAPFFVSKLNIKTLPTLMVFRADMTNTRPKTTEGEIKMVQQQIVAMGASNIIGGLLGTMGGGSTIGASIVACFQGSNGRYRICGVVTSLAILLTVLVGHTAIAAIPASALVGIIAVTVHHTFEYESVYIVFSSMMPMALREWIKDNVYHRSMRKIQRADAFVITLVTVLTLISNLGIAISAGLIFNALVYSWQSANRLQVSVEVVHLPKNKDLKVYHLEGPMFFGNARSIVAEFTPEEDPEEIEIHLRDAQIYDYSAINALNCIAEKYKKLNKSVHLKHISDSSQKLITKAHDLISHFTYDTVSRAHSQGSFELGSGHQFHIAQYPK